MKRTLDLIKACARIPSFSSYESRLHSQIEKVAEDIPHAKIHKIPDNNLIVHCRGNPGFRPIALTAHLDKINHLGEEYPSRLSVLTTGPKIIGQLDDAVGLGILLSILEQHSELNDPPLLLLFSEMEEGYGLQKHPQLIRNGGEGLYPRIGADRISQYLMSHEIIPALIITIDTTPFFHGDHGIAVYSKHWDLDGLTPTKELLERTNDVCEMMNCLEPSIVSYNNINDYIQYGYNFNIDNKYGAIPSIAIEPAIYPYHQVGEIVFKSDVKKTEQLLVSLIRAGRDRIDWLRCAGCDSAPKTEPAKPKPVKLEVDLDTLTDFLEIPLGNADDVFKRFSEIPDTICRGKGLKRFLYLRGQRKNKVLLVAHADTFWDGLCKEKHKVVHEDDGVLRSSNCDLGLGADDRAGCAILWLLKDSGHSLLVTSGEEQGHQGSDWLMNSPKNRDIAEEINGDHQFIVQFDRRNGSDFKCYGVGTPKFRKYIERVTGYSEPDFRSSTDIRVLCRDIAGVNLSIGYRNEHTPDECLHLNEWLHTLNLCRDWLSKEKLPRFALHMKETASNTRNHHDVAFRHEGDIAASTQLKQNTSAASVVRAAAIQYRAEPFKKTYNILNLEWFVHAAANKGAKIIVLPELCTTGYVIGNASQAHDLGETIPGPTTRKFSSLAKEHFCYIIFGMLELDLGSGKYFNTQIVIDDNGQIAGKYRKVHLYGNDYNWASNGDLGYQYVNTKYGRIGLGICYDINFDDMLTHFYAERIDIFAFSANWVARELPFTKWLNLLKDKQYYFIAANNWGQEEDIDFSGGSMILSRNGKILSKTESASNTIVYSNINIPKQVRF